jgi:hypothetical protein
MARKSEIRAAAKAALDALTVATQPTTSERQANAEIKRAFTKLQEAAGLTGGGGGARLRENGLLDRMGIDRTELGEH